MLQPGAPPAALRLQVDPDVAVGKRVQALDQPHGDAVAVAGDQRKMELPVGADDLRLRPVAHPRQRIVGRNHCGPLRVVGQRAGARSGGRLELQPEFEDLLGFLRVQRRHEEPAVGGGTQ